jgi:hypothetical protein
LLEAPQISVEGGLFANGGGGAGLCSGGGEDGREALTQASGDDCDDPGFGDGGLGGSVMGPPTAGVSLDPSSSDERVGGSGGGAIGRIRINSRYGIFLPMRGALLSPFPDIGTTDTR